MNKYEFVEKVSAYTEEHFDMKVKFSRIEMWWNFKEPNAIINELCCQFGNMTDSYNMDLYYTDSTFEEGVYELVNKSLMRFGLKRTDD